MVWAEIFNNHKANLVRVQGNLTGQCYRGDIVQQHILNVIDRQREILKFIPKIGGSNPATLRTMALH
jgi:hypothetical protein